MTDERFITMEEILTMIDEKYAYAIDDDVKMLLKKSSVADSYHHLLMKENVFKYFKYYAKSKGYKEYDVYEKIVRKQGETKDSKYNMHDVMKVFESEDIKNRIDIIVNKKTVPGYNGLVPIPLYEEYTKICSEKSHIELVTGYSERQIKLFSVPDDILIDAMQEKTQKISELLDELAKMEDELKDMKSEIEARGLMD